ncbi:hypothetical protein [Mesorhizobium sp. CN2-181]|uniref:hypothetical protein n=1 Tax=Mesorhizobium yinganensis TaxID=3157707 RepID=UPI0032B7603D
MHDHDDYAPRSLLPNPDHPQEWLRPSTPGYSIGSAAGPVPEGKVFVSGLNTYVDADVAAQLGLTAGTAGPEGNPHNTDALNPLGLRPGADPNEWAEADSEMSDEELADLQEQIEARTEREPSLSSTYDEIADCFYAEHLAEGLEAMIKNGDAEDTLARVSAATGLDAQTSASLIETTIMEAAPVASEYIGGDRWSSLVYAATSTPDPFARRVLTSVITGELHPSKLPRAYDMWWNSLPDTEA